MLACRASYNKETLARQVIPLAPGYRTALLSRPVVSFKQLNSNLAWNLHSSAELLTMSPVTDHFNTDFSTTCKKIPCYSGEFACTVIYQLYESFYTEPPGGWGMQWRVQWGGGEEDSHVERTEVLVVSFRG